LNRDAPAGQIATINISALVAKVQIAGPVYKAVYVRLADSYSDQEFPKVLPKPDLNEGNHLSYALQWILFALMAFTALGWAVRQENLARKMKLDPSYQPKIRKKIGDDDKAAEDAIR
jgi:cytochrome oxidase assembly protein ShyY1